MDRKDTGAETGHGTAASVSGLQEAVFTCRQVYEEGAAILRELEDGSLDARLLLEHFCGIPAYKLLADPETPVGAADREACLAGARRRAAREPLAYIVGEQSFMGLPFVVSRDVLIPEQDTENMVEEALRHLEDGSRILDLCTGSGCILLSLLHYSNDCVGVGTDISGPALEIARRNADALGLSGQVMWMQGDLFEALPPVSETDSNPFDNLFVRPEKYDMIIANPPYIRSDVIDTLAPEVCCAEPRLALDGGADGLDFYRRIIRRAPAHLVIGGRIMLEIGFDQAEDVAALLQENGYYGVEVIRDYGGNDRIVTAVRSVKQDSSI